MVYDFYLHTYIRAISISTKMYKYFQMMFITCLFLFYTIHSQKSTGIYIYIYIHLQLT